MKFDEILELLGGFGPYQKRVYLLVCLPTIPIALQMLAANFIFAVPKYRCRLPVEYNDTTYFPTNQQTRYYVNQTIPIEDGSWSQCEKYSINLTAGHVPNVNTSKETCTEWVYDTTVFTDSLVTEFNMVCENSIYRSHSNMMMMIGFMFGSIFFGILSDTLGRKISLMVTMVFNIASSLALAFVPNFTTLLIIRFVQGAGLLGLFIAAFLLGIEFVGVTHRKYAGIIIELIFCIGLGILAVLAYFIRDWSTLQICVFVPSVLQLFILGFVPESPRWLISRGKTQQADEILRKAAQVNQVELPEKLFDDDTLNDGPQLKVWAMFTTPILLFRCLIIFFNWIVINMMYFGLSLNVGSITGDIHINFTIASIVEFLGYFSCLFLLDVWGRKLLHCACMIVGGVACICTMFPVLYGDQSHEWLTITLSMIGKFGVSAAFAVIYVFSSELFPTIVRNSGLGACSFLARIGSISSPYIADLGTIVKGDLGKALPLIVFGGCSVAAGLLALFLPETLNKDLPETIEDAKSLYGNQKRKNKYNLEMKENDKNG